MQLPSPPHLPTPIQPPVPSQLPAPNFLSALTPKTQLPTTIVSNCNPVSCILEESNDYLIELSFFKKEDNNGLNIPQ